MRGDEHLCPRPGLPLVLADAGGGAVEPDDAAAVGEQHAAVAELEQMPRVLALRRHDSLLLPRVPFILGAGEGEDGGGVGDEAVVNRASAAARRCEPGARLQPHHRRLVLVLRERSLVLPRAPTILAAPRKGVMGVVGLAVGRCGEDAVGPEHDVAERHEPLLDGLLPDRAFPRPPTVCRDADLDVQDGGLAPLGPAADERDEVAVGVEAGRVVHPHVLGLVAVVGHGAPLVPQPAAVGARPQLDVAAAEAVGRVVVDRRDDLAVGQQREVGPRAHVVDGHVELAARQKLCSAVHHRAPL